MTVEVATRGHLARALGIGTGAVAALRVVIVAEGAGHGHALRAHALARFFGTADIIARPGAASFLPPVAHIRWHRDDRPDAGARAVAALGRDADLIIVDTFSRGLFGTLHRGLCPTTPWALVRRHLRAEHDVRIEVGQYDHTWLPYGRATCEWDGLEPGAYIGHPIHPVVYDGEAPASLAVVGDSGLLPASVRAALPASTRFCAPPYRAMPRARRYLAVGAGYHGVYRHMRAGHAVRFWPQARRFDDQFWRAERVGRLLSVTGAPTWLAGAAQSGEIGGINV